MVVASDPISDTWIKQLFRSIDDQRVEAFLAFLSDDVRFQFGNAEPVRGKTAVSHVVRGLFGNIRALRHEVTETWEQPGIVICHGTVTYTRNDSSVLCVPFANIFKLDAGLIKDYLIYARYGVRHDICSITTDDRRGLRLGTPISFATAPTLALSGGSNRATTLFLNASPYRAIFRPRRPQVQDSIEATTILTGEAGHRCPGQSWDFS